METVNLTWFNASNFQKILRNVEVDKSIEVSHLMVKPAMSNGDNYTSDIYRLTVEYSRVRNGDKLQEKRSFILKVAPYNDDRERLILSTGIFETELFILSKELPKINKILAKLSLSPLSARCLHVQHQMPLYMIVEDLLPKGFRLAERQLGLDLEHCLLAIRNLGRFHAASIALNEEVPTALTNYKKGMFHKDHSPTLAEFFKIRVAAVADEVVNWPELNPGIADKILKLSEIVYEKGCEATFYRKNDFNVLNHGDFWVNNMMFRYDDQEKPIDHIFVDFQLSHWGSPAEDINFFLGSSPADDVRVHHRELLLREYHSSLTSTMAKLQCTKEAPSFEYLQKILQERAFCEAVACMIILPVVTLEEGKSIDFAEMLQPNGECRNPGLRGKLYRKIMTRLLPLYDSMGLLNVLEKYPMIDSCS